ncbi:MAG: DUF3391 domain-containing protein [Pseudomonadota bacterium]
MLKTVPVSELQVGMFVEKMQGNWFDHPFWKSQFLIDDQDRLRELKSSKLEHVVINTKRGKDLPPTKCEPKSPAPQLPSPAAARLARVRARTALQPSAPRPASMEREVLAAQRIADRSKEQVQKVFASARLGKAINVRTVEPVVRDVLSSVRRNSQAFGGLMRCKLKNELVYRHSLAVSALMVSLAIKMKSNQQEVHQAGLAGLLLDIGVNFLPQNVSPANGDFRNAPPKIWQQHVVLGHRSLQDDDTIPRSVLNACLEHHERFDGTGFPNGLAKDEISRLGQMAAICDTFDYLLIETTSTKALDPAMAIQKLRSMEGAFNPEILRIFVESVGLYPVGSFVRLKSGKLAMVVDEDVRDLGKPVVEAFYSFDTAERIIQHRIELAKPNCEDEIMAIADLDGLGLPEDAQLRELVFLAAYQKEN